MGMSDKPKATFRELIVFASIIAGGAPWFAALLKAAKNASTWLRKGVWPIQSTAEYLEGWGYVHEPFQLLGIEKIAQWFLNTSAFTGLIIMGFVTAMIFGTVIEIAEKGRYA